MFNFISSNVAPRKPRLFPVTSRLLAIFGDANDVFGNVMNKLTNIRDVRANTFHTCHAVDEPVATIDGVFRTCESIVTAAAATSFAGASPPVRWCPFGLGRPVQERAVTLLHELTHQERTGPRTIDDNSLGLQNNAHNYTRWLNEAPGF